MNRTSIRPAGQAGIIPSTKPNDPDRDAIRTPDGTVFIHFYAGIWERLLSPELAARFIPNAERVAS